MMETHSTQFGWLNWLIVTAFFLFTTLLGEKLKSKGNNLQSFFKGSNEMPWWAVSLSLIATKTSASTFIAVPAFIFAASGDLTYLQATIGFAAGVFLLLFILLKEYYQENIFSPYDFIENRLGAKTGNLTRVIYTIGTVLSQGVKLLVTAVVLSVVSGIDTILCVGIIAFFAILWTYMGGIATVIWTDVIQYLIFTAGAIVALLYGIGAIPGGVSQILAIADEKSKLVLIDLSTDPTKLTLWAAVFGCTFFEFGSNAIDQTVTQRALCCKNLTEARKAVAFSAITILTSWFMAGVALTMVAYYHLHPMNSEMVETITNEPDRIFPYFVIEQLPLGVSGLIIAAIFAAGISTLDSALAALSHTSVIGLGRKFIPKLQIASEELLVKYSRWIVIFWGLLICALAIIAIPFQKDGLLSLGFKASGIAYGSLIGIAILGLMRKGRFISILVSTLIASIVVVLLDLLSVNFFWWYPVGAALTISMTIVLDALIPIRSNQEPNTGV